MRVETDAGPYGSRVALRDLYGACSGPIAVAGAYCQHPSHACRHGRCYHFVDALVATVCFRVEMAVRVEDH